MERSTEGLEVLGHLSILRDLAFFLKKLKNIYIFPTRVFFFTVKQ